MCVKIIGECLILLFSHSVICNSLWPHGLQQARPPCPSLSAGACSNSSPLSWWCHPTSHPLSLSSPALNLSQHQGPVQWVSSSHQVAKVLELQLQYLFFQWMSGLISFRIDWFEFLSILGTLKVPQLKHHFSTTVWKHQFFSTKPSLWSVASVKEHLIEKII